MRGLSGKRILITGAAGGLGQVLVQRLLEYGVNVSALIKTQSDADMMAKKFPGQPLTLLVADLSRDNDVKSRVEADIAANGPFYGLVCGAAIYPKSAITELETSELLEILHINAGSAATLTRLCAPTMRELGAGRIVNIASITFDLGMQDLSAYVASKGALIGMTRVWARELGPAGITVNAVSPGAFQTDAEKIHDNPEEYSRSVIDKQALKRRGDPTEFAELVAFLLSDHASFVTGQNIRVDGGWITG